MTHAAKVSDLTDGLVSSIAGDRSQHASYRRMREQAAKTFRNTTHARTNQFDVHSKLNGLVEKFAVLNRDDLSDALQSRLDEVPKDSKWMPEILSLLLQLSDRPSEKTNFEDVEALTKLPDDEQNVLTWDDFVAQRALDEPGLWDDVERGYHSSGDEAAHDEEVDSVDTASTKATSLEDDTIALARLHIVELDQSALDDFKPNDGSPQSAAISELTLVRHTLLMLRGLPTTSHSMDTNGVVSLLPKVRLETASQSTIQNLIGRLSKTSSSLNRLRQWTAKSRPETFMQSCQAAISSLFRDFGRELSAIEQCYVVQEQDQVVSLIDVASEVDAIANALVQLSQIMTAADNFAKSSPFALLDELYSEISVAEMSGDEKLFHALTRVFLSGVKTYIRPISTWIQSGTVEQDDVTSMIQVMNPDCDCGRLWSDRYGLRLLTSGNVCAPAFLQSFAPRIFAVGKGQAFLQALGGYEGHGVTIEGTQSINALSKKVLGVQLLPFSQLLDEALEAWIAAISSDSSATLHQNLLHKHGLLHTVDRLQEIFCSRDGLTFQMFADILFWRMDHQSKIWKHDFLLSELASSTFAPISHDQTEGLTVDVQEMSSDSSIRQVGMINMQTTFSWPVQNITRSQTSNIHSKIFAFALQIYRAKYLLRPQVLDLKSHTSKASAIPHSVLSALLFRQRLLCFVDVLQNHIAVTAQVLHASLKRELEFGADIDAMAATWASHMKDLEMALLLAQKFQPIREAITGCLEICEQFPPLWLTITEPGAEIDQRLSHMSDELGKTVSFIVAGVRSVGRASGSRMLEELAERLEWTSMK